MARGRSAKLSRCQSGFGPVGCKERTLYLTQGLGCGALKRDAGDPPHDAAALCQVMREVWGVGGVQGSGLDLGFKGFRGWGLESRFEGLGFGV